MFLGIMLRMKTVLLVEDDRGIRDALKEVLQSEGYRVITADNGKQALVLVSELDTSSLNLILLDLMMPVMTGQQFLEASKDQVSIAEIPIAVFSADGKVADFHNDRVSEVIRKPVDLDGFLQIVARFCR